MSEIATEARTGAVDDQLGASRPSKLSIIGRVAVTVFLVCLILLDSFKLVALGSVLKTIVIGSLVAAKMGFAKVAPVTGQTYNRKVDAYVAALDLQRGNGGQGQ